MPRFQEDFGITVGMYIKEFEKEASEGEVKDTVAIPSKSESGEVDVETGLLTPASTVMSSLAPGEDRVRGSSQEQFRGNIAEAFDLDLDIDFNFDEWVWAEDFPNDSTYG